MFHVWIINFLLIINEISGLMETNVTAITLKSNATIIPTIRAVNSCQKETYCKNNGTYQESEIHCYCLCTPKYHGRTCNLAGPGISASLLDDILNGTAQNYDRTIEAVLDRMTWTDMVVVIDVTGSMHSCAALVYRWMKNNRGRINPIKYYVFFNDGDDKNDSLKVIGSTGGLYGVSTANMNTVFATMKAAMKNGDGGDGPENDIEALLFAIQQCPTCLHVVHIADNSVTPRDMILVPNITKPVHVIPCELGEDEINPELLSIVSQTSGSFHTLTKDDLTHSKNSNDCSIAKIKLVSKPSTSLLMEYKRNEEIFISSNIQLCENISSIIYQWVIHECTPTCSKPIKLNREIQITSNEIYIPPNNLTYGTYRLNLTIKNSSHTLFSSASIDIKITGGAKVLH